jgi:AcrR family transcriptional regulator
VSGGAPNREPTELVWANRHSPARQRTIEAALALFAEHGVSGTSFQMIADAVGVTKAAIYHQFKTKDAIVQTVAEVVLAPLKTALETAELARSREEGRQVLITNLVHLAVARRRWARALFGDPVMDRFLASNELWVDLIDRVYAWLLDIEPGPEARVRTAIASAAMAGAISHPLVADIDDDSLRVELMAFCRRLFDLDR